MPQINIQVLIANDCLACHKVLQIIHPMRDKMPDLCVEIINVDEPPEIPDGLHTVIIPATYVNGRLFAYGEFEPLELINVLERLIQVEP